MSPACVLFVVTTSVSAGPSFLGCYNDNELWAFQTGDPPVYKNAFPSVVNIAQNSIAACQAVAMAAKSQFYGMEAGIQCWWVNLRYSIVLE